MNSPSEGPFIKHVASGLNEYVETKRACLKPTPISIRVDGFVLGALKTEAERQGIPYQNFTGNLLHRYVHGELVDKKAIEIVNPLKRT